MSKAKTFAKIAVLKGQEAEDRVLEYIKRMNRPYGAVDVASNLKGAVPKTAAQRILVGLAERGELVQKPYGKTVFFAPNQGKMVSMTPEELTAAEDACKAVEEECKELAARVKAAHAELAKIKSTPRDDELPTILIDLRAQKSAMEKRLSPLRSGAPVLSAIDLAALDSEWTKWRAEWVRRRKIFNTFWAFATESLPPQDIEELAENLGVELDSDEHAAFEKSWLCAHKGALR